MAGSATPSANFSRNKETRQRLERCWSWILTGLCIQKIYKWYDSIIFVNMLFYNNFRASKIAMNITPCVLTCFLVIGTYVLSSATVKVTGTYWSEPVLLWMTVVMPTGSGKSTLCRYLFSLVQKIQSLINITDSDPTWISCDASFKKMGAWCTLMPHVCLVCMMSCHPFFRKSICTKDEIYQTPTN